MTPEEADARFERLLALLERLLSQRQDIHVHVHNEAQSQKSAKTIAEAIRDAEPPRPFPG